MVHQLKVGDAAPDFALKDDKKNEVSLSSFKGKKNVLLAFFPLAFTPV
jgi:peroxiredoxin (alkyl hydroperoxide reductase subunit C)